MRNLRKSIFLGFFGVPKKGSKKGSFLGFAEIRCLFSFKMFILLEGLQKFIVNTIKLAFLVLF